MPISASVATTTQQTPNLFAGTTFNFYSPGASSNADLSQNGKANATAESSAASGSARAATTGVGTGIGDGASNAPGGGNELLYIGAGLAALYIFKGKGS